MCEQEADNLCVTFFNAYGSFGSNFPIFLSLLAIVITLGIIGLVIFGVQSGSIDLSGLNLSFDTTKAFMMGVGVIAIIMFSSIVIFASLC